MSRLGLDTPKSCVSSRFRYPKVLSRLGFATPKSRFGLEAPCLESTSALGFLIHRKLSEPLYIVQLSRYYINSLSKDAKILLLRGNFYFYSLVYI